MARARNIKPTFFVDEDLVELSFSTRLLFIGLWTLADREGRLPDKPKSIKMSIFPCDRVDVDKALTELQDAGFLTRYVVDDKGYIEIRNFAKHQKPHPNETESVIPPKPTFQPLVEVLPPLSDAIGSSLSSDFCSLNTESGTLKAEPGEASALGIHVAEIWHGVMKELSLKKLSETEKRDWENSATLAFENEFTADDFLECFSLMRKQKWRTGVITPETVRKNLPNLANIKREITDQANGKTKQYGKRTDADVLAESADFYAHYDEGLAP